MSHAQVAVDGQGVDCPLSADATLASAFVYVRDRVLGDGKIVTDVRIDDDPVTWDDGDEHWSAPLTSSHRLAVTTDYAIRITGPLLTRLAETLPVVGTRHREWAAKLREQAPQAAEGTAELLMVWQEVQQALDQVCQLHGLTIDQAPWNEVVASFRTLFERLTQMFRELKESLELGDMVLSADLLDFELAPLAEDFVEPCLRFRDELEKHHPARSG
ncbi:hypothetical protein K2X85_11490 [bacterium]|jgi:hypothetical protein|nr:hypothetical protein [bacterium]